MYKYNDLSGRRFGRLIAMAISGKTADRHLVWNCVCDCGNHISASSKDLVSGHTQSCGCLQIDRSTKHGGRSVSDTERLYFVWRGMISRCETESATGYEYYGARGIGVCDEWHDYNTFKQWAIGSGYDSQAERYKCTLDRIDCNGNYEPDNCRWVDMHVQNLNKRISRGC